MFQPAAFAAHGKSKLAKDMNVTSSSAVDGIVPYKTTPGSRHFQKAQWHGAAIKTHLGSIHAAVYTMPANQVANLVNDDSDIAYVSPDRPLSGMAVDYTSQTVNAPAAWNAGLSGAGVGVAIVDSGCLERQLPERKLRSPHRQHVPGRRQLGFVGKLGIVGFVGGVGQFPSLGAGEN